MNLSFGAHDYTIHISNAIHAHEFINLLFISAIWMPNECFAILNLGFYAHVSRFPSSFDHFTYCATSAS